MPKKKPPKGEGDRGQEQGWVPRSVHRMGHISMQTISLKLNQVSKGQEDVGLLMPVPLVCKELKAKADLELLGVLI